MNSIKNPLSEREQEGGVLQMMGAPFNGYLEELHRYQDLLVKQEELEQKHQPIADKYHEAINVIQYLEKNSYQVDLKLIEDTNKYKASIREWMEIQTGVYHLEIELNLKNLRHALYAITTEAGLSLEELAEKLNCSNRKVFSVLCEKGSINKQDYQKLCNYFGLNEELWKYHYVYPKTEYAASSNFCGLPVNNS